MSDITNTINTAGCIAPQPKKIETVADSARQWLKPLAIPKLEISSTDENENDLKIRLEMKPKHLRTPPLIYLSCSEDEAAPF
ncbi:MAG: hypothetical protein GY822_32275 [Deltaproteobacteria bacterium]|nr:hypothetical protein [Deltaproteobacteria bacterium]